MDAIRKGAVSYFEAEHYSEDGMSATSKQYPTSSGAVKTVGTTPSANTVGVKQNPSSVSANLAKMPWNALNFVLTSPFYYTYSYKADGSNVKCEMDESDPPKEVCAPDGAATYTQSHFEAMACASLNEDKDSVFSIKGDQDGNVTAVRERTSTDCTTPVVP